MILLGNAKLSLTNLKLNCSSCLCRKFDPEKKAKNILVEKGVKTRICCTFGGLLNICNWIMKQLYLYVY